MVTSTATPDLTAHMSYNSVQIVQFWLLLASQILDLASGPDHHVEAATTSIITLSPSGQLLFLVVCLFVCFVYLFFFVVFFFLGGGGGKFKHLSSILVK